MATKYSRKLLLIAELQVGSCFHDNKLTLTSHAFTES